ncbi:MAG: Asp23/Gls24 family envelope stress response protein [Fusobacterium sp.]|nr:Asp23/Gls24 family envelope stress response protein [Fusobacterium sp.]
MSELGNIRIAEDVVKSIAARACLEVEGVYKLSGGVVGEVSKILGKKKSANGVKVEVGEKECSVEVFVIIEYGYKIPEVAVQVQKAVLENISTYTGLKVVEVNVYIQNIKMEEEKHEVAEVEEEF